MGSNRSGRRRVQRMRRAKKEHERLASQAMPTGEQPAEGLVAKVKTAGKTAVQAAAAVAEGLASGFAEGLHGKKEQ